MRHLALTVAALTLLAACSNSDDDPGPQPQPDATSDTATAPSTPSTTAPAGLDSVTACTDIAGAYLDADLTLPTGKGWRRFLADAEAILDEAEPNVSALLRPLLDDFAAATITAKQPSLDQVNDGMRALARISNELADACNAVMDQGG